ncbi:hypothetical protein D046_3636B, partial [Vibrio parahaemolyticus V-223/04]
KPLKKKQKLNIA